MAAWVDEVGTPAQPEVELRFPCADCRYRVRHPSVGFSISELRMFRDATCVDQIAAHAIASVGSLCDGVPVASDGVDSSSGEWCGEAGDWLGLMFGDSAVVQCVHAVGGASLDLGVEVAQAGEFGI